jgi:6-phosphogluconolactonase
VTFSVEIFAPERFGDDAAQRVGATLPRAGSVVLTGGTTAQQVYGPLARRHDDWSAIDVFFSDERCVPPTDPASNYGMAARLLLEPLGAPRFHRMKGEDRPERAADDYDRVFAPAASRGVDVLLLGMGGDCHVAALFPGSRALGERSRLCLAVDRPDGLTGLTLTPPALLSAKTIFVIVSGATKAEAVRRAVHGDEPVATCPARLLAEAAHATFLLDEAAAARLELDG